MDHEDRPADKGAHTDLAHGRKAEQIPKDSGKKSPMMHSVIYAKSRSKLGPRLFDL